MAKKYTIDLEVNQNAQQASKDFDNLNKSIKGTNDEFKKTEKTMSDAKGVDKLTQKMAALDAQIESGDVSLRDMSKLIMEYQSIAAQAGSESPVGNEAIQKAAALQDKMTDLRNRTKLLSSDYVALDTTLAGIGVGAQAFSGITSAMALTGVESEKLREAMLKVQAVQGVANSISAITNALNKDAILGIKLRIFWEKAKNVVIGKSTGLMKGLRIAMAGTGIGLLVAGIASLIGNFDKLFAFMQPVIDAFKRFGDWIGITNFEEEELEQERQKRAEAEKKRQQEAIDDAKRYREELKKQNDLEQRYSDNRIKRLETQRKLAKGNAEEERKIDEQITEEKLAQLNKQKEDFIEDQKARLKELDANRKYNEAAEKRIQAGISTAGDNFYKKKKRNEELFYELKEQLRTNDFVALEEIDDQIAGVQADATLREKDELKKREDNYKKYLKARLDAARRIEDIENRLREEGIEKDLEINRDKFRREREDLEKNENLNRKERIRLLQLSREEEAKEEKKIRDKYAEEKRKEDERREKEASDALKQVKVKTGQETLNLLQEQFQKEMQLTIANDKKKEEIDKKAAERRKQIIAFSVESTKQGLDLISQLTDIYGQKSEKAAKRAFQIQKAVSISQATIDTYKGANAIFASAAANPSTVLFPAQPFIAAGLAIAAGIANITKIATQKFEGGGATGGGATGGGATGLEGGGAITPEFNVVGDSGINQLAQLQQQPVQAFVVSGDVTTAQSLDRNRVQNATL